MWLFRSGIVVAAYSVMCVYTGARLLCFVRSFLPSFKAFVFWPLYLLLVYGFMLVSFLRLDDVLPLRQAAVYAIPFTGYFFLILLLLDITRLVFLRRLKPAGSAGIALGLTLLAMVYGYFNARNITAKHYGITLSGAGAPLRLALASDLHIGEPVDVRWLSNIVDRINSAEPDIICLAGDLFHNNLDTMRDPEDVLAELRRLKAPLGIYACPGNHDMDGYSLSAARMNASTDGIYEFLKKAGIVFLRDELVLVDGRFYLAGRRDARPIGAGGIRKPAAALFAERNTAKPLIVMDHQPVDYPEIDEAGGDLILSGHTHRGQFFPGNIATAYIYKKAGAVNYGYWKGNAAQGVVSSGAGLWGPAIRIGTSSEVVVIDIRFGG